MRKIFILPLLVIAGVLFVGSISAAVVTLDNPIDAQTLGDVITSLVKILWGIALGVCPIMIIVSGFYFLNAGGNPERIKTAKNLFLYAVIGLIVAALATAIVELLKSTIQ